MRVVRTGLVLLALLGAVIGYVTQPLFGVERREPSVQVDPVRLEAHVRALAVDCAPRDARHPENLERAAKYVRAEFEARCDDVTISPFTVGGSTHHNVCAAFGEGSEMVIVGAHYDAAEPGIGADDNASGVAALIELAGLLARDKLATRVELIAFALEEPPYFRTKSMGSYVDAQALGAFGLHPVRAMLSLEMLGYYSDEPGSQTYPAPGIGLLYPSQGNFIAVVSCLGQASLVRRVKRSMAEVMDVPVRSINAPRSLPGVDFSDQLNYWDAGYDALMITDTAFYRNPNYHESSDLPETLDYARMASVVEGIHAAVLDLASEPSR